MNDIFQILKFIQRRMKACKVPHDAISCETDERVIQTARRALELHWITKKRTEELYFVQAGNVWIGDLRRI